MNKCKNKVYPTEQLTKKKVWFASPTVPGGEGFWLLPSRFGGFTPLPVFLAGDLMEACTRGSGRRVPVLCGERPTLTGKVEGARVNGKMESAPR